MSVLVLALVAWMEREITVKTKNMSVAMKEGLQS